MSKITKKQKLAKRYSRVGKITGILAVIALPSASLIAPIFCKKTISGSGCDLSSVGTSYYFIFTAFVLAFVSIISFILSAKYKEQQ